MGEVECQYCGAINNGEEHRCVRCNRRLLLDAPQPAPDTFAAPSDPMAATAVAPAFESLPGGARRDRDADADKETPERPTFQPSLFRESTGTPKVIPIPTLTPLRPQVRENPSYRPASRAGAGRSRRVADSQSALEFHDAPDDMGLQMDVIYCDAPVALPAHRAMAAAVDASIVVIALGVFLAIFFLAGGDMTLNRQTVPFLGGLAIVIGMFYRFLWCLGNGDTPGMRFAGLRLVDFDGRRPDREQRGLRQIVGLLSVFSAGLGLVWALVDEESLTWHDHISKTFPTPG